ncbi:MAG: hypothetical protein ACP5MH_10755 [Thermoproteus sp.]
MTRRRNASSEEKIQLGSGLPMSRERVVKYLVSWLQSALLHIDHSITVLWYKNVVRIVIELPRGFVSSYEPLAEGAATAEAGQDTGTPSGEAADQGEAAEAAATDQDDDRDNIDSIDARR